jgi:hypothetical protein
VSRDPHGEPRITVPTVPAIDSVRSVAVDELDDAVEQVGCVGEPQCVGAGNDGEFGMAKVFMEIAGVTDVDVDAGLSVDHQSGRHDASEVFSKVDLRCERSDGGGGCWTGSALADARPPMTE